MINQMGADKSASTCNQVTHLSPKGDAAQRHERVWRTDQKTAR